MSSSRILLDSHVVLWLINGDVIGPRAMELITHSTRLYCSAASIWELTIKANSGKLKLPDFFLKIVLDSGIKQLDITSEHAAGVISINLPHSDPFDRLLVSQAQIEDLVLLTADATILASGYKFVLDATR